MDKIIEDIDFDYKDKPREEIIEYIESLTNSENDMLKKAYSYLVINEKEKAKEIYFEVLSLNPNKIEAYIGIADVCYYSGEYLKAIDCLYRANEIDENNIDILLNLATNFEYVNLNTALRYYNKIIEIDDTFAGAYIDIGRIYYYYFDNNEKALEYYNKGIELNPDSHIFYNARGTFYLYQNRFDEALDDFNKCIKINDDYVRGYTKKAEILLRLSVYAPADFSRIIALLKKAESIGTDDYDIFLFMGIALEKINDYDLAENYYKKHIDIYGDHCVMVLLSMLYLKQGKVKEAKEVLNDVGYEKYNMDYYKIIKKIFDNSSPSIKNTHRFPSYDKYRISVLDVFADYLYIIGYENITIKLYEYVCRKYKNIKQANLICGSMHMKKGNIDKALYYFKKQAKLEDDNRFSFNNIGVIYKQKGKYKKALRIFKNLMIKYPDYANPVYNIATIYYETKDYKNAIIYYEKCLNMKNADNDVITVATERIKELKIL